MWLGPAPIGEPAASCSAGSCPGACSLSRQAGPVARRSVICGAAGRQGAKQQGLGRRLLHSWRSPAQAVDFDRKPLVASDKAEPSPLSSVEAAALQQQQAEEQRQSEQQERSYAQSLYTWLRWGSGTSAASSSSASIDSSMDAIELADGMAGAADVAAAPARRSSSWYSLGRSGSSLDAPPHVEEVAVDHPTLQLVRQRVLQRSQPGQRNDPWKLGLVVEGGGMRGCVSGGALQALSDLGLRDAFDAVYGSSAGAINATYFLSGQNHGVDIYHDKIACEEFISLRRLWKGDREGTPVLNLPFLIDHVMQSECPLDWQAVLGSPIPLKVVASSLDMLQPVILERFADQADLAACLKASAHVPEIAGTTPLTHRGQRLVDAAVFEPVPFRSAIADGCTHVLVLGTRPRRVNKGRINTALEDAMEAAIKRAVLSPDYMRPAWQAEVDYLAADGISQDDMLLRALEEGAHEQTWFAGSHVYPVYPGPASNFSPLCIDAPTLRAGIKEGRRSMLAVLQAVLGDLLDFSRFEAEANNIQPLPRRSIDSSSERLWRTLLQEDFSHH